MKSVPRPLRFVLLAAALSTAAIAPVIAQPPQGRGGAGRGQGPDGRGFGPPRRPADVRDAVQPEIPVGSAVISGTVVVAGLGQPARRARVTLNGLEGGGSRSTMTDENGNFVFSGIVAGKYNLSVTKTGHVGVTYGQTQPGRPGTPIQLGDGEKFSALLNLPRGSVITGTVLDEYGEPTPGTQVRVLRYVMQAGRRTLQQSGGGSTDDRGVYRVYGLQPGDYVVSAVPRNAGPNIDPARMTSELQALRDQLATGGSDQVRARALAARMSMLQAEIPAREEQATGYAPVYYPGTVTAAEAAPVPLAVGEERSSIDFQLQRVPMADIDGTVVNSAGQPTQNIQLTLTNASQSVPGIGAISARADTEGRFRLTNVPPGMYRLIARANVGQSGRGGLEGPEGGRGRGQSVSTRLWGSVDVPVDGRNLSNVVVTLQQGLTVSGRIAFAGAAQQPADLSRMRVNLAPIDVSGVPVQGAAGTVDASGKFTIPGVVPGIYRLTASGAGNGWFLDSSLIEGQDTLDFPVDVKPGSAITGATITFTDKQAQLSGAIVNQRGQPAPHVTLILYAADEHYWAPQSRRIRSTRPATDGQFTFTGFPAGDYKLVALADVEPGSWFDPVFLQQMEGAAISLRIGDGEKKIQNVQIAQ